MASNPMQRQKRVSFLLGVIVTLLICSIAICGLGYVLFTKIKKEKEEKALMVQVYTLSSDVSSGQVVTSDMLKMITVSRATVPSNAVSDVATFNNCTLQTEEGEEIFSDQEGLFMQNGNKKTRLTLDTNGNYKDSNGETIKLKNVPLIAKVNMKANTVITRELVAQSDEVNTDDVRIQEYNMITLPSMLNSGDFVDIRLRLPNGVDYIVVSKKEVTVPSIAGIPSEDTINVNMSEDEILTMSNAMVEAYIMKGSELYATRYTDPGNQEKSIATYPVSKQTMDLINSDPNIVETARQALWARYNVDQRNGTINSQLNSNAEQGTDSAQSGIQEQIQRQKEMRKKYLQSLGGTDTY